MQKVEKGLFMQRNNLALIIAGILFLLFIVLTALNINLAVGYFLLVAALAVAFLGIVPYVFEDGTA